MLRSALLPILLLSVTAYAAQPFVLDDAMAMVRFACATNCGIPQIAKWNCSACDGPTKGFEVEAVVWGNLTQTKGYVGYLPSKKIYVIAFEGSNTLDNWISDLEFAKVDFQYPGAPTGAKVHVGFYFAYLQVQDQIKKAITSIVAKHGDLPIMIGGHSLGGALATLCALDLSIHLPSIGKDRVFLYTFGSPRVGNRQFASFYNATIPTTYRIVHYHDIVPHLPPSAAEFVHVVEEVWIKEETFTGLSSLKFCSNAGEDPSCANSVPVNQFSGNDHVYYMGEHMQCSALP